MGVPTGRFGSKPRQCCAGYQASVYWRVSKTQQKVKVLNLRIIGRRMLRIEMRILSLSDDKNIDRTHGDFCNAYTEAPRLEDP